MPAAAPVGMAELVGEVLVDEGAPPAVVLAAGLEVDRMNDELAVGPAVLVELDRGKAQLVEVEVVVEVEWPGQLVAVGLHWVMVSVLVRVWVDVVVMSASCATARVRPVARTVRRVLNCMVAVVVVIWDRCG